MDLIEDIRKKMDAGLFEFSKHAVDPSLRRGIRVEEVREAISNAEIIEVYPDVQYDPILLVPGFTRIGRPLQIQRCHPSRPILKLITGSEPDADRRIDFRNWKVQVP